MEHFFCIYSGKDWPESERSKEHIVPFSIGGSNRFVTFDVSHEGNNTAGHTADAELINTFFMASERWERQIPSDDGHVPPLEFKGTTIIDGKDVRTKLIINPDRSAELTTYPEVDSDWQTMRFSVGCDPAQLNQIIKSIQTKGAKRGLHFDLLQHITTSNEVTVDKPTIVSDFSFQIDSMNRGFIKMALGTGHHVLGYNWSKGPDAAQLRACLLDPAKELDWQKKHRIHGSVWPSPTLDQNMRNIVSAGPDRHVLMVLNLNPLSFIAMLFGEYDGMIRLHDGVWNTSGPPARDGRVVVIDTKTRDVWEFQFMEYIARKQKGTLPWT